MKAFDQFHDGYFDGLTIEGTSVNVHLRTYQDERYLIEAKDVVALIASEFTFGNIIFDVLLHAGEEITLQNIIEVHAINDQNQALKMLDKARRQNLVLLEINPTCGAYCRLLAHSINLVTR